MIGIMVTQTVRVECDRCGAGADYLPTITEARGAAVTVGFVKHEWMNQEIYHEIWLCRICNSRTYKPESIKDGRCGVFVQGEQCGKKAGHEGGHVWLSGD